MTVRKAIDDGAESFDVRAAGGVIFRGQLAEPEIVIVHRPRYDDWTSQRERLSRAKPMSKQRIAKYLRKLASIVNSVTSCRQ